MQGAHAAVMRIRHGFSFLLGVALAAGIAIALRGGVPLDVVATIVAGLVCLAWLGAIVVLPWNLHFEARHLEREFAAAKARGVTVTASQEQEATRVARRMLWVSLALHAGSAVVVGGFAWLSSSPMAASFAALFLLSTLFRPGVESYRYLKEVLTRARAEVSYPRDDVLSLVEDVRRLVSESEMVHERLQRLSSTHDQLARTVEANAATHRQETAQLARTFEGSLERLTDNQEILAGLKAFLRLVQQKS